ncbi:MAG: META domain-containing protein [Methylocystis sp.]|nr:META domain-containing protein [Methylocystis sp.]MBI3275915.1 META domain-containing protein [Methylocystis sp.]
MKRFLSALLAAGLTVSLATAAPAKRAKPAPEKEGEKESQQQQEAIPSYKPFPYYQTFLLKDINGKTPPVEIWITVDKTGHGAGFSGCKNWSAVFIVGANRLGPKAMPAVTEQKCDAAAQELERDYWNVLLSGPYWDTQGSDLILKGFKGGVLRFTRSL